MTRSLSLAMHRYSIEPRQEKISNDVDFCQFWKIYLTNMESNY